MSDSPNLPKLELGGIVVWDARQWFPDKGNSGAVVFRPRAPADVAEIAIHHDAVAFSGLDLDFDGSTVDEERARMQASYNWHTKYWPTSQDNRGDGWNWPAMGYHLYVFPKSGRIYLVGDLATIRAHVANRNTPSIGIVGAGDFTRRRPGGMLIVAYGQAAAWSWLWRGAQLPIDGHRVWAAKNPPAVRAAWGTSCPGNTHASWIPDVRRIAKQAYESIMEDDSMTFIGVGHDKAKTGRDFESFRLYVGPNGLEREKIGTKEERLALAAAGYPLRELTREQLEQYAER